MKGFRTGVATSALLLIFVPYYACIPNADVSGLPPFDGGGVVTTPTEDSGAAEDATVDSTVSVQDSGQPDAAPLDGALPVGAINGVVIDYTQANGRGVAPGAIVTLSIPGSPSASLPAAVTADANGLFSIPNVPAGVSLQISTTKPTDLVNGIAYSTSLLIATVTAGQTLSLFPVLHEGCFETYVLNPAAGQDAGNVPHTLQNAQCRNNSPPSGAYAAITFEPTSFTDPATSALWTQAIRIEMIPLAYPSNDGPLDLSWALGLPGVSTPSGLVGAAEYRVVKSDPGQPDDGEALALAGPSSPVGIAVPVYTAPTAAQPYSYNPVTGAWVAETTAQITGQATSSGEVTYEMVTVPHLTWWGVTNGPTTTTCMTGTLQGVSGEVLVRGAGSNYLGTSTAVTSNGAFCLDVNSTAGSQVEIYAGALVGGVPSSVLQVNGVSATSSGTCGGATTGCTALGPVNLTPTLSCISGTLSVSGGVDAGSTVDVLESFTDVAYASSAGILQTAYVGQAALGAGSSFCALAVPGGSVELIETGKESAGCPSTGSISLPTGSNAPTCAGGGCADAGALGFGCF